MSREQLSEHFYRDEFECSCGCGFNGIDLKFIEMLEASRQLAELQFNINSGCRCFLHNMKEGGEAKSAHLQGYAADIICVSPWHRFKMVGAFFSAGFTRIIAYKTFIHVDVAPNKAQKILSLK